MKAEPHFMFFHCRNEGGSSIACAGDKWKDGDTWEWQAIYVIRLRKSHTMVSLLGSGVVFRILWTRFIRLMVGKYTWLLLFDRFKRLGRVLPARSVVLLSFLCRGNYCCQPFVTILAFTVTALSAAFYKFKCCIGLSRQQCFGQSIIVGIKTASTRKGGMKKSFQFLKEQ